MQGEKMELKGFRERKTHGNALFPMDIYTLAEDESYYYKLYCHWHDEFEILYVTKGGANFTVGQKSFCVYENEAVCVLPDELHSATAISGLPCHYFAVVFHPILLTSGMNDIVKQRYLDPVLRGELELEPHVTGQTGWGAEILFLLNDIKRVFSEKENGYELWAKIDLLKIWFHFIENSKTSAGSVKKSVERNSLKIKAVIEYIHNNYQKDITLSELAALSQMSEGQFCRFFKATAKMSAVQYLNCYRISQSTLLLGTTEKKIGEIAVLTGFNNISYFNKVFKSFMQCSPTDYRNRLQ